MARTTDERDWTVEELTPPAAPGAAGWEDFVAMTEAGNRAESHAVGHDAFIWHPEELLPRFHDPDHSRIRTLVAWVDGRIVARGTLTVRSSDPGTAEVTAAVLPEHRGRGVGDDLRQRLERWARDGGAMTLTAASMHGPDPRGPVLPSPTGTGEVGAEDAAARFVLRAGYRLAQTERASALDTRAAAHELAQHRAAAAHAAGSAYRVVAWTGPTPEARLDDLAVLSTRMSTDIPLGDLPQVEDVWDAERVRADDVARGATGRLSVVTAAEHVATGRLVAFTEIAVSVLGRRSDGHAYAYQQDTLVMREHRGHRLGMLIKAANLALLAREAPEVDRIVTWNADENRPMLAINEALGFVPIGTTANWIREVG